MHVGATPLHPLVAHPSDAAPVRIYPSRQVNVAVEPCAYPLLRTGASPLRGALSAAHEAVGAALGTVDGMAVGAVDVVGADVGEFDGKVVGAFDGDAVGTTVGDNVSHVGTASVDQPTEPTPTTLHVRVVATLIANPTKQ